jgi:hypothetical protein
MISVLLFKIFFDKPQYPLDNLHKILHLDLVDFRKQFIALLVDADYPKLYMVNII